ncbi:MAG TPA: L,D-transpeptidase, partial [Coriobacteriia bacterium]
LRPARASEPAAASGTSPSAAALSPGTAATAGTSPTVDATASGGKAASSKSPTKPVKKPKPAAAATGSTTATTALGAIKPLKPAPGVKTIVVDKSDQVVTLYTAKGIPVDSFRCASGIVYPRIGTYHVYGRRYQSWSMYDSSTFYYFTMFVKSDKGNNIGFHSIPTIKGKLVGGLGKPVSHGCVRLDKAKAKFVYSWATVGTKVVIKK